MSEEECSTPSSISGPRPSSAFILLFLIQAVSFYACSSGPTPTACLCWKWRTWWSWVINQTPNVSSPTYSLWSTTCADTRCPWVDPVTSDLCSESVRPQRGFQHRVVTRQPPSHPTLPKPTLLNYIFTWWQTLRWTAGSQSCTSLMDKLGMCVFVCQFAYYLCWQWWC